MPQEPATCCSSISFVVVGIWQFGNSRWELRKNPRKSHRGEKNFTSIKIWAFHFQKKKGKWCFFWGRQFWQKMPSKSASQRWGLISYMSFLVPGSIRVPNCWGMVTHPTFTRNPFNEWVYEKPLLLGCLCFWLGRTRTSPRWLPK